MRRGLNPGKLAAPLEAYGRHRVIVPVFIPYLTGYFDHALEILRIMLESIELTAGRRVALTVIANGCAPEVLAELRARSRAGTIDQLVVNQNNRGKVDAVVSAARSSFEELITVADADVLFLPGWLEAVEAVYSAFPECGAVSPSPNPALASSLTSSTLLDAFVKREIGFQKVVPDADLDRFASSVGNPDWFAPVYRNAQLVVKRRGTVACIGAGHFVITLRRVVVQAMPLAPALHALKVGGEQTYLDEPADRLGLWKLATPRAFAFHLGNILEPWMYEELERCRINSSQEPPRVLPPVRRRWVSMIPWRLRKRLSAQVWKWILVPGLKKYWSRQSDACSPARS